MSNEDWDKYRDRIIGLGDNSGRKSYYPELQKKIRELEEKNQNLSTFFDNTNDAIIIHNAAGEIIRVNKKAKEFCNFDKSGTIPILMQDLVVFENKTNSYVEISKKILEGESMLFETRLNNTISNTIFFAEISLKRTIWSGTDSIIAIIRDVSQRKKHENDLFKAKEKAEESSRLKSLFLANMSHEIRTPLNSIAGFSQLITDQSIPIDKREQYSQILIENSYHLIEIVEDIIRMSEIDSGISEKNVSTIELSKHLIE
jgi:PAS domain S-box-containing protein